MMNNEMTKRFFKYVPLSKCINYYQSIRSIKYSRLPITRRYGTTSLKPKEKTSTCGKSHWYVYKNRINLVIILFLYLFLIKNKIRKIFV